MNKRRRRKAEARKHLISKEPGASAHDCGKEAADAQRLGSADVSSVAARFAATLGSSQLFQFFFSSIPRIATVLATVATLAVAPIAIAAFPPKLRVTVNAEIGGGLTLQNTTLPSQPVFTITNDGYFDAQEVWVGCGTYQKSDSLVAINPDFKQSATDRVPSGESWTFHCHEFPWFFMTPANAPSSMMVLQVYYRYSFLHRWRLKEVFFEIGKNEAGKYWIEQKNTQENAISAPWYLQDDRYRNR